MNTLRDFESQVFSRVNPAVKFSVTRYVLAIGVFVAVVAFGIVCTLGLGVDLMPSATMPVVSVGVSYPGANPTVVDQQITQIIENQVSTLSNITDINSSSSVGNSRVQVSFDLSVDKNAVVNQVAALVASVSRRLPSGANAPSVQSFNSNSEAVLQFGMSGGVAPLRDVADFVENSLAPSLERVPGVANVSVDGAPSREFQVLLDPSKLRFYNLTSQQVTTAISSSAVNQPIGTITSQGNSISFVTKNVPEGIEQISRILVDSARGVSVRDLGVIRDATVDSSFARVNGQPVILVSIQRTNDSNSIAVADGVNALLKKTQMPKGYTITMSNDSTGPIRASVKATYWELFSTLIVVALIVLLFLGKPNTAFSVILAIPIALSASPILYKLAGFSFNLVSLLAMVIAIGIVVDDSIVVAENVERYRKMGFSLKEAVLKGASEVFSAVVAASLSLLSVLLPVSFIGGFMGRYLQQFSLGLAAAVAFSLFEAILFLTVRLAYTPEGKDITWRDFAHSFSRIKEAFAWGLKAWRSGFGVLMAVAILGAAAYFKLYRFMPAIVAYPIALGALNYAVTIIVYLVEALTKTLHGWTEAGLSWLRDGYTKSLGGVLKRSVLVLIGAGLALGAIALFIVPKIPINFVPQSDSGSMDASVRFPAGTPQGTANKASAIIEAFLISRPEVQTVQTTVNSGGGRSSVMLVPVEKRKSVFLLAQDWRKSLQTLVLKDFPTARLSVGTGGFGGPGGGGGFGGASVSFNVVSADYDLLTKRNAAIINELQQNPWVADVNSSLSDTNLENDFIPDPEKLKGTGLSAATIASALQTYASGSTPANVVTGGLSYPIRVKINPTLFAGGQSLLDLTLYSSTLQASVQVSQLGHFQLNEAPNSISRYNRQYTGSLNINLKPGAPTALEFQNQVTADLTAKGLLDNGMQLTVNSRFGAAALASQLLDSGKWIFLLALFLVYLVMAAQFNSWRYPIYLLLPVPLAIIGAFLIVWVVGGGLDIFGLMGMLMLIGLSAKNAILYLDFVLERLGKMPLERALTESARLRFRPIVMTTLTVLVISFPLIFSTGQGSEFGQRMGLVMLGGIVFSAILTFFVVPAAFYAFERNRQGSFNKAAEEIAEAAVGVETGTMEG
jgi:hydrophobic/amphiphilic exporter-1 (mainly G- bacteria), HAE1 family